MELQYFGANCLKLSTKKTQIVIDPKSDIADLKVDIKKAQIVLATRAASSAPVIEGQFLIDGPGEYEFQEASIKAIAAQAHTEASGDKSATMYRIMLGDTTVLVTGHINEKLSEDQLEEIGLVDIVVVPVGGGGYTLDGIGAAAVVRALEPKLVIPVHYNDKSVKYSVPQQELELFTKELGAPVEEAAEKYKVKVLPESLIVQPLTVS